MLHKVAVVRFLWVNVILNPVAVKCHVTVKPHSEVCRFESV